MTYFLSGGDSEGQISVSDLPELSLLHIPVSEMYIQNEFEVCVYPLAEHVMIYWQQKYLLPIFGTDSTPASVTDKPIVEQPLVTDEKQPVQLDPLVIEQLENGQLIGFEFVKSICQSPNVTAALP